LKISASIRINPWLKVCRTLIPVCALLIWQAPVAAETSDSAELKQLRNKIETLEKELTDTEGYRSEAAGALRESEKAIDAANRRLTELARQRRAANSKLGQLKAQSAQIKKEIAAQQWQLRNLLYGLYIAGGGRKEYLSLLLSQRNPNEIARNLHYYEYFSRARKEGIDGLRANLQKLETLSHASREKSAEISGVHARHAEQKVQLEQQKDGHAKLLAEISLQAEEQRREINRLRRNEDRLTRLVEKLTRMLAKKKKFEASEKPSEPGAPAAPASNSGSPDSSENAMPFTDGTSFSSLRGRLNSPVRGELANRFGSPRADGGVTWKGLFIRAAGGESVKAIANGRVVFADWLRGFGNLMILDHGDSYMSLYGNNEAVHKRVGDVINAGETIATVGNSSGNSDTGLYFELRHQGKPFDPLNWVRIK
jgi:septal ring factor EnvC (AmiA/AmiB activator)